MSLETKPFPQRDLNLGEIQNINMLTGSPQPIRHDVVRFLRKASQLLEGRFQLQYQLQEGMTKTIAELDYDKDLSRRIYLSGALFYLGVAQIFGSITVNEDGVRVIGRTDGQSLISDAPDRLRSEAAGFTATLERILPVLDCGSVPPELALVGAGASHMAVTKSLTHESTLLAMESDPSLADLAELFKKNLD